MAELSKRGKQKRSIPKLATKEVLAKAFPKAYIANGLNGGKAILSLKPHLKKDSAITEASVLLGIPHVRQEVVDLLSSQGLTVASAVEIHKRNMLQGEHLPTSQRAVETVYELTGLLKNADKGGGSVNVAVVVNK